MLRVTCMVLAAFCLLAPQRALADPVPLSSTVISFSASGSPNTIAGSWYADGLNILTGAQVQHFVVEVLAVASPFGIPNSLTFTNFVPSDSRSIAFGLACPLGIACVGSPLVGSISMISVGTVDQWMALDFLLRLDLTHPHFSSSGSSTVGFANGGGQTSAQGSIRVTAWGTAMSVPEPSTFHLLLAIALLAALARGARFPRLVSSSRATES